MKLWLSILVGVVVVLAALWLLAIAVGLLHYVVIAAVVAGILYAVYRLWPRRGVDTELDAKQEQQLHRSAQRELKRLEQTLGAAGRPKAAGKQAAAEQPQQQTLGRTGQ